ncbi:hypothetical protein ACTOB_003386 [Actinoplanes oblitus]|uniref:Uncharacterized protein n=1 Tax=Actinoplanes oblitus TaxID=3040509 RepID=A0ABY8WS84_9ACTN|nr:hypothetical protein [Actinoplanes oblitus]WIM99725.1 hypothetical protein ACTOB_003386 [Actinoplanes oblitus]
MVHLNEIRSGFEERGLLREAARLYARAVLAGDTWAAILLVGCWDRAHPGDLCAARWVAESAPVDDSGTAASLLLALRRVGADAEARELAGRVVAGVRLDDPSGVASLVTGLRELGEDELVRRLAERGSDLASLDNPWSGVDPPAAIVEAQRWFAEEHANSPPAGLDATTVRLDDPIAVSVVLHELREEGELDQAHQLAVRASPVVGVDNPYAVSQFVREARAAGAGDAVAVLVSRDPAEQIRLDRPYGLPDLLIELHEAGAHEQVTRLARRITAGIQDDVLHQPGLVQSLLHGLWHAAQPKQVRLLAGRVVGRIQLSDQRAVAGILDTLVEADAQDEVAVLLSRDLGMRVTIGIDKQAAALVLAALRKAGANDQAEMYAQRLPEAGQFLLFREQPGNEQLYRFGREADGTPAPAWDWDDVLQ